ncbi:MAG: FKBP-type peptidyl-prolyl cis-trans isomerase [Firmicutes bacterium]|nr:FKBP-type peptidyl-prolyl cis-trans isomerase [Bacillota bacterium]
MKKFLFSLCALLSALLLASCGGNDSTNLSDYDLEDYVEVADYSKIEITETVIKVTEDDINDVIDDLIEEYTEVVALESDEEVALGDDVTVTYAGYIEGEFDGFTDGELFTEETDVEFTLGSGGYVDGFEDGLIGAVVGEEVEFSITYPDDYTDNEDLAGITAKFVVTVTYAEHEVVPEYTNDFVAEHTDYSTTAEYEAYILEMLEAEAAEEITKYEIQDVWEKIVEESTIKSYPEAVLNAMVKEYTDVYTTYAEGLGYTLSEYLDEVFGYTEDEFLEQLESECTSELKDNMIFYRIVEIEGIAISDSEYATGAAEYAEDNGFSSVSELEAYYGEDVIRESLLWDKTLLFLLDKATILPLSDSETTAE